MSLSWSAFIVKTFRCFTESQNSRGWKGPLWSSSPTLLPKQGHLQQAAQDLVQAGLEYLQRRRLHCLPGQPGPGLRHPQREEVLPHVQTELPLLQFVPIAPCPVTGHHWKELGPILLTPPPGGGLSPALFGGLCLPEPQVLAPRSARFGLRGQRGQGCSHSPRLPDGSFAVGANHSVGQVSDNQNRRGCG